MRARSFAGLSMTLVVAGLGFAAALFASGETGAADWKTTAKVKLELLRKLGSDALAIDVDTREGVVRLTGEVEKRESRELAGDLAKAVDGVRSVDSELRLEGGDGGARAKGAEAGAEVEDAILESRIRIALIDALGADGFRVGTEAASGVVVLEFDRQAKVELRNRAVRVVEALEGVERVTTTHKR